MSFQVMLQQLTTGFGSTLVIFFLTLLFSLPLGMVVYFGRVSRFKPLSWIVKAYISIMRGTPLMLQLLLWYFGPFYLWGMNIGGYKFTAIILGCSLNYAAYFAEIYRSGIESIPVGQYEAAQLLGYNKSQTFFKIVLPQVVKIVLPSVTNEVITLVKDTSLVYSVSYIEMFALAKQIAAAHALGAFGTGVGCTDFLYGMVTGTSWVLVPESVKFNLTGKLPEGVYARDLILTIIGEIGANGCNYQAMEFTGEGAKTLSISDRMALCNMAVEAGAKTGIFEADEKAIEYLKEHGREPKAVYHSDPDAVYAREYTFDLSKVRPVVAKPDFVDNVVPAEEACGIEINEAFLGSCNNGRIEDLRVGAEIIKGKKVAEGVRFLVVPASQTIYRQALKEGLIDTFMEAGAIVMNPNCSVCWGSCQGVIGENEVLISTGTRNFKGRAGHPSSKVYLGSAATVTASAITGKIALASEV